MILIENKVSTNASHQLLLSTALIIPYIPEWSHLSICVIHQCYNVRIAATQPTPPTYNTGISGDCQCHDGTQHNHNQQPDASLCEDHNTRSYCPTQKF